MVLCDSEVNPSGVTYLSFSHVPERWPDLAYASVGGEDSNMLEFLSNRWEGKGNIIRGTKLEVWERAKNKWVLMEISR